MGVAVLGSTGSIGVHTLDVLGRHRDRYRVVALAANSNVERLRQQCLMYRPRFAVVVDAAAADVLAQTLRAAGSGTQVLQGAQALIQIAAHEDVGIVMAAIVGAAGLASSLAAARAGKRILLANKEALVMSGPLFMQAVREGGATLVPVDSEHNAIFQCMAGGLPGSGRAPQGVRRVLLTASGGPFLRTPVRALRTVTPEQACAHPRWVMGRKISVDSATLMNKGLELIEACLLFDLPPAQIEIVVHPQSIVHSLVEYVDGSVLAQMGNPDMRTPIAHALGWPSRLASGVESLDILRAAPLDFEAPDLERFPSLRLARAVAEAGGTTPAALNAANEIAVGAFLERRLAFMDIPVVVETVLERHDEAAAHSLDDVLAADAWARREAQAAVIAAAGVSA
ncbi:1-deoxy-D-xylulose 5-phosphate reductoisomerase [Steroidobacter denitrificans]|uniref:1-deoxy-D-xylulose 5-phosphate reductoisomerase n=1 Tax=Steroidobacter denitrificans TaxID=465721 RepID=A0A127FCM1_STEDE|nr:1-deoxy-D-xylulose 5-phosphate reductoisomerase [Steroidobacter denitrificans]